MRRSVPRALTELSDALHDVGVSVVTGYPGYFAHNLMDLLSGARYGPNEKSAFATAWGAAAAGAPSAVVMKNVGLSDAVDPFVNAAYLELQAPMLVICFDDLLVEGSQLLVRTDLFLTLCGGISVSPRAVDEVYAATARAWSLSHQLKRPALLRLTSQVLHDDGLPPDERPQPSATARQRWRRRPDRQVAHPVYARDNYRRAVSLWRDAALKLAPEPLVDVMSPPDSYATLSDGPFIINDDYEMMYAALRSQGRVIVGDLGTATMDSARSVDICLCLGASVSVALGVKLAQPEAQVACVIGDGGLLHSGRAGLDDVEEAGIDLLVIVIENGGSATTGGQALPGDLSRLYHGRAHLSAQLTESAALMQTLKQLNHARGLQILSVRC